MPKLEIPEMAVSEEEVFIEPVAAYEDRTIGIDRISRTVKGGRRIRFRALIVVGDRAGHIGFGLAKANDVQTAIAKAKNKAEKNRIEVPIYNDTIKHEITLTYCSSTVLLKPAPQGHSIIAGGSVRAVIELAGIKNIVSKSIGSSNAVNVATATFLALKKLADTKDKYPDKK